MGLQEGGTREGGGDNEEDEEDVCVLTLCDDGLVVDEEYQRQKRRERDLKRKRKERERRELLQDVGTQDGWKFQQVRAATAEQDKSDRSFPQKALGIPVLFNHQQQPQGNGLSSTRGEVQGEGAFRARSRVGPDELGWQAEGFHARGGTGNGSGCVSNALAGQELYSAATGCRGARATETYAIVEGQLPARGGRHPLRNWRLGGRQ